MRCCCLCCLVLLVAAPLPFRVARGEGPRKKKRYLPLTKRRAIVLFSMKPAQDEAGSSNALLLRYGVNRDDLESIQAFVKQVEQVVPFREIRERARHGFREMDVRLIGTTDAAADVLQTRMQRGRFFARRQCRTKNNVCVIGPKLAAELFPGANPVGRSLRIGPAYYLVMGTLRNATPAGIDKERFGYEVYVPYSTMRARFSDLSIARLEGGFSMEQFETSRTVITVRQGEDLDRTAAAVRRTMQLRHGDRRDFALQFTAGPDTN